MADAKVAELAARQHGVASHTQLLTVGLSTSGVRRRVQAGRLHRIYRGVYAVGHSGLSNHGRWMAAVLACGEGSVLSHRSAAELWDLLQPTTGTIQVTSPTSNGRRKRPGLRIHRSHLPKDATTIRDGIAVTTPARTLADLRPTIDQNLFRKAVREAEFRGLHLGDAPTDHTRSELERAFLQLCRRYGLPAPEVNVRVGRFTVDFLWREQRLVVETDGWGAHRGNQAFEDDHERELELHRLGYRLRRFTDLQIRGRPAAVAATVEVVVRGSKLNT